MATWQNYLNLNSAQALNELSSDQIQGLNDQDALQRIKKYGPNILSREQVTWWQIFFRQFKSPFIYLLLAAIVLSFMLGEITEGLMILLFIIINVLLGFYQEFKSEKTLQLLRQYVKSTAKVIRDGKEVILASEQLVPGDLLTLVTGDKILADVRFIETHNLTVDESVLTGESISVKKNSLVVSSKIQEIYQAENIGFSGSTIVNGSALALVIATGAQTVIGDIAKLTAETSKISNFEKGISRFSSFILRLIVMTLFVVFVANLLFNRDNQDIVSLIIFSIALAVSVIPEALPVVTTFSLAHGAKTLAKNRVVVKRLSAIEDLGGVEILCTDKTGTLTENKLTVADIYSDSLLETMVYANLAADDFEGKKLEPFDIALAQAMNAEQKKVYNQYQKMGKSPFNPDLRRNAALVSKGQQLELVVRGAPEVLMSQAKNISATEKIKINEWIVNQGRNGKRVLAVAYQIINSDFSEKIYDQIDQYVSDFTFLGVVSFVDPIKESTFAVVRKAQELGVKIVVLTGDSPEVAGAVAEQIGLINKSDQVMVMSDFMQLDSIAQQKASEQFSVFARVAPEQKHFLISMLQEKYAVGFLGEGINDTPALKAAGVSIVVQSAADVSREAADIILLEKDLLAIFHGIEEGRKVFANTVKYIKATLISNFGNFYAVAISTLFIDFLPMLPIQILLLNLLSDFPMIAISTDYVDGDELKKPKQYNVKDITLIATVLGIVSTIFDFIFFALFYRISPETLQTNWFIGSIITELILIYSVRTNKFMFRSRAASPLLSWLTILAVIVTVTLPFTAWGQSFFSFQAPQLKHLLWIFGLAIAYLISTETMKLVYNHFLLRSEKNKVRV